MLSRIVLSLILALPALTSLGRAIACPASPATTSIAFAEGCAPVETACCCGPMTDDGSSCGCVMDSAPAAPTDPPLPAPRPATTGDQILAALTSGDETTRTVPEDLVLAQTRGTRIARPPATHHKRLATLGVWRM